MQSKVGPAAIAIAVVLLIVIVFFIYKRSTPQLVNPNGPVFQPPSAQSANPSAH